MPIRDANSFWIEAGAMSGDPNHRHQIEFSNELAEFFDEQSRDAEIVLVRLPGGETLHRPLTYRGTDYGQWTDIWRLGLPTARMGGPQYAGRVIKFERLQEGGHITYAIEVADANSETVAQWRNQSTHRAQTGGAQGREYGYW
jgi:hypothetical protein